MSRRSHFGWFRKLAVVWAFSAGTLFAAAQDADQQTPWQKYHIDLTPEETAWLKAHPVVNLGFDPEWPPFSFRDKDGQLRGIDIDLISRLEERLGIRFEPVPTKSWEETDALIHSGKVDVVSGISRTASREDYLLFTSPYITCPVAVITREEAPFLTTLHDLKNVRLASPRGYVTTEKLREDYPALPLTQTSTSLDALTLVSRRTADVAVENLPAASYLIRAANLNNLKIAGITDYRFDICLAVRKDWPELRSALQKALTSMSDADRRSLLDHWTSVEYFPVFDWPSLWKTAGAVITGVVVLLTGFGVWNRRLAQELDERRKAEAALKTAHDRLHEVNREKDRFMSMAAHDLNNPLGAIVMKCGAFEMDGDFSQGRVHEMLTTVRNNALRMSQLINNLLKADRLEHGEFQLDLQPLDLSALTREALENLVPCSDSKGIVLEFTDEAMPARVNGDRESMLQVLENLISNAIKFSPSGKTVSVEIFVKGGKGRVEVRDEGPGITDDDRAKLFKKYATLSARPTANEPTNGLGLSIAKTLVESMKGTISCECDPGKGARFSVQFPLAS